MEKKLTEILTTTLSINNREVGLKYDIKGIEKAYNPIKEQHAKMVDMLTYIMEETNFQSHFPTTSIEVKNLLSSIKKGGSDE